MAMPNKLINIEKKSIYRKTKANNSNIGGMKISHWPNYWSLQILVYWKKFRLLIGKSKVILVRALPHHLSCYSSATISGHRECASVLCSHTSYVLMQTVLLQGLSSKHACLDNSCSFSNSRPK